MNKENRFDKSAETWDTSDTRVMLAQNIYEAIVKNIELRQDMEMIDFGAGTGLLSRNIALHVKSLLGVDTSSGMLAKLDELGRENINTLHIDICAYETQIKYDGIVSSMTMHHVQNLDLLFTKMNELLKEGGFVAIADLMSEDGTFHNDNDGVHHFGFDEDELIELAQKHGFSDVKYQRIFDVNKEGKEPYGIFLLTAKK
ncbi:MAG: class I SAM-dependent methyltransferase [Thiovulaceae bacterium]|nr:class I SAM-dependent methyltransferase [Sulfurimonadaceae bacterium]